VSPGNYKASVSGASVVVTPAELEVTVAAAPVLDASFGEAALHVRGKVVCLEPPCKGVEVTLEQGGKVISKSGDAEFAFDDVAAGSYTVKVARKGWCWQKQAVSVRVGQEDTSSVKLVQTGFEKPIKAAQVP